LKQSVLSDEQRKIKEGQDEFLIEEEKNENKQVIESNPTPDTKPNKNS
jgi:hypothetical protein